MKLIRFISKKFVSSLENGGRSSWFFFFKVFLYVLLVLGLLRVLITFLLLGPEGLSINNLLRDFYLTFLQMTDPGNMSEDLLTPFLYKLSAVLTGLAGILLLSCLIAIFTNELARKIGVFNKGRTGLRASGHTLILGWDENYVREIIAELAIAKESENKPMIIILAENDKVLMDDYISYHHRTGEKLKVVTRSGDPSSVSDLHMVSACNARSVIVLPRLRMNAGIYDVSCSDNAVIKTLIALSTILGEASKTNVVTEIYDERKRSAVDKLVDFNLTLLHSKDIISKIVAQLSQSRGVSEIYNQFLSFKGSEIYSMLNSGRFDSFADVLQGIKGGLPVGYVDNSGAVHVAPPDSESFAGDEKILLLSMDDSHIRQTEVCDYEKTTSLKVKKQQTRTEAQKILIVGWGPHYLNLLKSLNGYLPDESQVCLFVPEEYVSDVESLVSSTSYGFDISVISGDASNYDAIHEQLKCNYDAVILLPVKSDIETADTKTIISVMNIKDLIKEGQIDSKTEVIAEIIDSSDCDLIAGIGVTDFVVSKRVIGSIYAQLSENPNLLDFYEALFDSKGAEVYLIPVEKYFESFSEIDLKFKDVFYASRDNGDMCIGVKSLDGIISLAPEFDSRIKLLSGDELILLTNYVS